MSLISKETLLMQLQRSEMASEVTLPIDSFRDLLYQAMPKEWVGLTDEQIVDLVIKHAGFPTKLAKAIEAKLKQKNNIGVND